MRGRNKCYKCTICGKFISYKDIENNLIIQDFTPDTQFSVERIEMTHVTCKETKTKFY